MSVSFRLNRGMLFNTVEARTHNNILIGRYRRNSAGRWIVYVSAVFVTCNAPMVLGFETEEEARAYLRGLTSL